MLVIVGEWLVILVNFRQVRVGENLGQQTEFSTHFRFELAVAVQGPATIPHVLVFPFARITDTGLGFNIVEPCVFHTLA